MAVYGCFVTTLEIIVDISMLILVFMGLIQLRVGGPWPIILAVVLVTLFNIIKEKAHAKCT